MLVSPEMNHNNSTKTPLKNTFLVVNKGKPSFKSYLACAPNKEIVPVLVLSSLYLPLFKMFSHNFLYYKIMAILVY